MHVVSIGAGNVATHLSKVLHTSGFEIVQVYSRSEKSAKELSDFLKTSYTTDIGCVKDDASLYIISVSDEAVESVVNELPATNGLVVHTSGSVSIDVFSGKFENYGVLYPLQTFSKNRSVDFSDIPLFLEANSQISIQKLRKVAESISENIFEATSADRKKLHLSAVFGCNFVNHLFHISAHFAKEAGFEFSILSALLHETVNKAIHSNNPKSVQTGPAIRNDRKVIQNHLEMLSSNSEYHNIYAILSENIYKMKKVNR